MSPERCTPGAQRTWERTDTPSAGAPAAGEPGEPDSVAEALAWVGMEGFADRSIDGLSGGEKQRVALARAVALDPMMVMYDEPFTGQDPISMGVVAKLIRQLNDALDITSIVVSHDVHEIGEVADYSYVIADGKVAAQGRPEELTNESSDLVRQFMLGLADGPVAFHYDAPDYAEQLLGPSQD